MNDLISRQAAIDALTDDLSYYGNGDERAFGMSRAIGIIEKLPPAQPEKRTEERMETHACDCISRQMLLEYIHGEPVGRLLCDKYNLDGLIEQFPSAQPKWIPVTERLPARNGRYLVTRGNDAGTFWNRVYIVNYSDLMGLNKEKHWWTGDVGKSNFERILDVLAWMPLPDPWKGEQG